MEYTEFIIIVNVSSIIILSMMAILLCIAARFKGESSYATLIIALTTIPIYTYNVCHSMELYEVPCIFLLLLFRLILRRCPCYGCWLIEVSILYSGSNLSNCGILLRLCCCWYCLVYASFHNLLRIAMIL